MLREALATHHVKLLIGNDSPLTVVTGHAGAMRGLARVLGEDVMLCCETVCISQRDVELLVLVFPPERSDEKHTGL